MKFEFVENKEIIKQPNNSGIFPESNGGTERMYRGLKERLSPDLWDKFHIICSRVREIDETKIPILWLHDVWNDPENVKIRDVEYQKKFKKFVFVSNYQFNTYNLVHGIKFDQSVVLKNAIVPLETPKKEYDKIRLIYHTTPHRGLELLIPAFDAILKYHPNLELDIFSSFQIYNWPNRDEPYKEMFEYCKSHPNINYHGYQPNEIVREALSKAHIFSYPSIWPETSCIAAIEAMSAECAIVAPDFAAIPETTMNFGFLYRFNEDPQKHVNAFATKLEAVIKNIETEEMKKHLQSQKLYADNAYSWDNRIKEWEKLLNNLQ